MYTLNIDKCSDTCLRICLQVKITTFYIILSMLFSISNLLVCYFISYS